MPDVGADAHPLRDRALTRASHDRRVAGMKSARDVGAGDNLEQGVVVTHPPLPEALAEVAVQIKHLQEHTLAPERR